MNGDNNALWEALNSVKGTVGESATDGAVIRKSLELKEGYCRDHADRIRKIEEAGRPPSKAMLLTATFIGQLFVGGMVLLAAVRILAERQ